MESNWRGACEAQIRPPWAPVSDPRFLAIKAAGDPVVVGFGSIGIVIEASYNGERWLTAAGVEIGEPSKWLPQ